MRVVRQVLHWKEPEITENIDAIVFLFRSNPKGPFCFIHGLEYMIHQSFLEGCLRWPSVIDWEEPTKRAIIDVLSPHLLQGTKEITLISREIVSGDYTVPDYKGSVNYNLTGIVGGGIPSSFTLKGIDDSLGFLWVDGKILVGADGSGMEKKELMFFGAELLFGEKVSRDLREAVYGVFEKELPDGTKISVNHTELARKMLNTFRVNNVGPGSIVLSAEAWAALAEEQARKGAARPSLN